MATQPKTMSAGELQDLLVSVIAGATNEPEKKWRPIIGPVKVLGPAWRYIAGNWRVTPVGSAAQKLIVEQCVDIVRAEHPYVRE